MKNKSGDYSNALRLFSQTIGHERVGIGCLLLDYFAEASGGVVGNVVVAVKEAELLRFMELCGQLKLPFEVLGQGKGKTQLTEGFAGLLIKNKVVGAKIVGVKGKVNSGGIGFMEATVEIGSGASLAELNLFLSSHGMKQVRVLDDATSSIGERLVWDIMLGAIVEKVKYWEKGELSIVDFGEYSQKHGIVVSVILRTKSNE